MLCCFVEMGKDCGNHSLIWDLLHCREYLAARGNLHSSRCGAADWSTIMEQAAGLGAPASPNDLLTMLQQNAADQGPALEVGGLPPITTVPHGFAPACLC